MKKPDIQMKQCFECGNKCNIKYASNVGPALTQSIIFVIIFAFEHLLKQLAESDRQLKSLNGQFLCYL